MPFRVWCELHASVSWQRWNALEQTIVRQRIATEARANSARRFAAALATMSRDLREWRIEA